jgi:hypothetical protein
VISLRISDDPPDFSLKTHPAKFDSIDVAPKLAVHGKSIVMVAPWDTVGSMDDREENLRPLGYPGSDVIALCISIADPQSLQAVQTRVMIYVECKHLSNTFPHI